MIQGEELQAAYASADVFMMPSESETLGFVVLEAMASGLPVVAVAAGGLTDILTRPGETGGRLAALPRLIHSRCARSMLFQSDQHCALQAHPQVINRLTFY